MCVCQRTLNQVGFVQSEAPGTPPPCPATILDESSESSVTVLEDTSSDSGSPRGHWMQPPEPQPEPPSAGTDGTLLAQLEDMPDNPIKEEPLDSQDTASQDSVWFRRSLNEPGLVELGQPPHWSTQEWFWDSVELMVHPLRYEYFYDGILHYTASSESRPLSIDIAFAHAVAFIRETVCGRSTFYKIGITGHPLQRWYREDGGYSTDPHGFTRMTLLWIADCSSKHRLEGSGRFETRLVELFDSDQDEWCINRPRSGGECPARGSPQFCYVVWS